MTTAMVKRTRRVSNPFDARLEVRLYSTELAKLRDEAKKREMSASDLVRSQLGDLILAAPPEAPERPEKPEPTETPAEGPATAQSVTSEVQMVDLAEAIAEFTDNSWGHAMLKIRLGKVTVSGNPWPHNEIPIDRLQDVAVDGELLPIETPDQESAEGEHGDSEHLEPGDGQRDPGDG